MTERLDDQQRADKPSESNELWAVVRLAAEGSDWKRDQGETIVQWAERTLRTRSAVVSSEPVAWMCEDNFGKIMFSWGKKKGADPDNRGPWQWRPLYTAPVVQSASERTVAKDGS